MLSPAAQGATGTLSARAQASMPSSRASTGEGGAARSGAIRRWVRAVHGAGSCGRWGWGGARRDGCHARRRIVTGGGRAAPWRRAVRFADGALARIAAAAGRPCCGHYRSPARCRRGPHIAISSKTKPPIRATTSRRCRASATRCGLCPFAAGSGNPPSPCACPSWQDHRRGPGRRTRGRLLSCAAACAPARLTLPILFSPREPRFRRDFRPASGRRRFTCQGRLPCTSLPRASTPCSCCIEASAGKPVESESVIARGPLRSGTGAHAHHPERRGSAADRDRVSDGAHPVRFPGHVKSCDQLMREAQVAADDATITSHIKRIRPFRHRRGFDAIDTARRGLPRKP